MGIHAVVPVYGIDDFLAGQGRQGTDDAGRGSAGIALNRLCHDDLY